jgi:transaldolase
MGVVDSLNIKIYADGADREGMLEMYKKSYIQGFTTNPTLMRKAGVENYESFARDILEVISDRPISFEVFADEFEEMERQALEIAEWGENVYVKIPITNTRQQSASGLIQRLSSQGVRLNITAILALDQVQEVSAAVQNGPDCIVSVFAGRIADTGVDPIPVMKDALSILESTPNAELLWASPREVLNIYQADAIGCHIITATNDLLRKLSLAEKNLFEYSLETVRMFYRDAKDAGYQL